MSYNNTAIAPDGKRYSSGSPELAEPFDEPEVVRAIGTKVEGAVPTVNADGETEWTEGGGGEGVSTESATAWLKVSYDFSDAGNSFAADDGTSPWPSEFHSVNVVQWDGTDITPEGDFTFDGLEWDATAKTLTLIEPDIAYFLTSHTSVQFDGIVAAGYRADVSLGHPNMSLVALPGTPAGILIGVSASFIVSLGLMGAQTGVYIGPSDFDNPGVDVVGGTAMMTFTKIAG